MARYLYGVSLRLNVLRTTPPSQKKEVVIIKLVPLGMPKIVVTLNFTLLNLVFNILVKHGIDIQVQDPCDDDQTFREV